MPVRIENMIHLYHFRITSMASDELFKNESTLNFIKDHRKHLFKPWDSKTGTNFLTLSSNIGKNTKKII